MIILGINTSLPQTEISLISGAEILYEKSWKSDFNEAEKLLPAIQQALKKQPRIEKIFIVKGPGSFTGLRVGSTIANTLAFIKSIRLVGINTFEYLKHKIPADKKAKTVIMLKAGGKNLAYMYPQEQKIRRINSAKAEEIFNLKKNIKFATGHINNEQTKLPEGIQWIPLQELLPMSEVLKTIPKLKKQSHKLIKPVYLNPPQITKSKKQCFT